MATNEREPIVYEVTRHIGVLANYANGWTKELNLVSWNNAAAKYDLRDWDKDHKHMSRGITLHPEEMKSLKEIIQNENF